MMNNKDLEELLKAEAELNGEDLIAAQVKFLKTSNLSFPGEFHDEDECTVCDARRKAIDQYMTDGDNDE